METLNVWKYLGLFSLYNGLVSFFAMIRNDNTADEATERETCSITRA